MKSALTFFALVLASCGAAAEPVRQPDGAWERHSLPGFPVSALMPCSADELDTELLPVDIQVACVLEGSVFALMYDPRKLDDVVAGSDSDVRKVEVSGSSRSLFLLSSGNGLSSNTEQLIVELPSGGIVWAIHTNLPSVAVSQVNVQGSDRQEQVDQFFNSVQVSS